MPWIPHLMVLDDDPRVLESLVPGFVQELARDLGRHAALLSTIRRGEPTSLSPPRIKVTAHGFESERIAALRVRPPHEVHLHLVRERGGRFDLARRLLNEQLFATVVSDLRFSEDAGGQRAGQLFVDEVARVHPRVEGILYSAYPRPEAFPAERFVRKGDEPNGLADAIAKAVDRNLADPAVAAFATAIGDQGVVYQSDSFGTTLAQLFDLARLLGSEPQPPKTATAPAMRSRRPLPCLLVDGESGTGKRALAALFHAATDRRRFPLVVASCNELTNETLLRSILFGHKRGAFTDARDDRAGLVATAGRGVVLLDDFHRLPPSCSAILHSFLEDGEYSRLGEEEVRRQAEAAVILTVETGPWLEKRRSGELPLAFLARVERLPLVVPPLRQRPEDIAAQARWITRSVASEVGAELELSDEAVSMLVTQSFSESNSRELRNVIERSVFRFGRETEVLGWEHLRQFVAAGDATVSGSQSVAPVVPGQEAAPLNEWQRRLRHLAAKILARGTGLDETTALAAAATLFESTMPPLWAPTETARTIPGLDRPIPCAVWEDLWRCFSVSKLGGPSPAEKVLGIPANTLRQWINDRESR